MTQSEAVIFGRWVRTCKVSGERSDIRYATVLERIQAAFGVREREARLISIDVMQGREPQLTTGSAIYTYEGGPL